MVENPLAEIFVYVGAILLLNAIVTTLIVGLLNIAAGSMRHDESWQRQKSR